jgi:hypothetical protein
VNVVALASSVAAIRCIGHLSKVGRYATKAQVQSIDGVAQVAGFLSLLTAC